MLDEIVGIRACHRPRAVIGLWPAARDGDDIAVFADEGRSERIATFHTLRQQIGRSSEIVRRRRLPILWPRRVTISAASR
jgi:cobalamin-dependent methionine synthase I